MFVHRIDPVLGKFAGFYLWWYGLSYTLGFLEVHLWLRRARTRLKMSLDQVYGLTLFFACGVLLGGRLVEVIFYEWPFYKDHLQYIPAYWLGGMSTHGLLLGAVVGVVLFCAIHKRPFLQITDELAVPGAFVMGVGRIGNFIDGQILGRLTDVWWSVQFPDAPGFRHPVVLYDGIKNLLLIPLLLLIRRNNPPRGVATGHFIFWYGFLRLFVDLFREYPTTLLGLATGQSFNLLMAFLGAFLLFRFLRSPGLQLPEAVQQPPKRIQKFIQIAKPLLFFLLLAFCLTLPSDWTQDVPARYAKRHPGLSYSYLYPRLNETP